MMAYLTMMAQRISELHRVLKPTGSIYLHCDPTASHYLKLLMDAVFGFRNYRNEIVWGYKSRPISKRHFGKKHDTVLFYSKTEAYIFNWRANFQPLSEVTISKYRREDKIGKYRLVGRGITGSPIRSAKDVDPRWEIEHPELVKRDYIREGYPLDDWWNINIINQSAKERLGYPAQKPEALLERIIQASSNEGDLVLDPFCGCGTSTSVSERLKRRWIGIDITHLAVTLMRHRLNDTFGPDLSPYEVIGDPKDLESARALAQDSEHEGRYQFEWWALGLVNARPAQDKKKGADRGIDGYINFFDDNSGKAKTIIVQVKSGGVKRGDIATLKGDMEREKAQIGVFITLEEPTRPMIEEAVSAGFYEPEHFPGNQYPRIQILTIRELLEGGEAQYPRMAPDATFKRARRHRRSSARQSSFLPHSDQPTP